MIRCSKCGFSNKDFAERCIKCRSELSIENMAVFAESPSLNKKTIQVMGDDKDPWDGPAPREPKRRFIEVGIEKEDHFEPEASAGEEINQKNAHEPEETNFFEEVHKLEPESDLKKEESSVVSAFPTVRRFVPERQKSFQLIALSPDDEKELRNIDLQGNEVVLDRAMLDPSNTSISRNGHANIYLKDGNWYIENTTALKTTFVQVNQPVKLSDGDVILLGDSLFKFKKS